MTPSEVAWLKKEVSRKQYTRETRDSRDYVIDEVCEPDDCGAEESSVYSERLRESVRVLIAENEAKDAEIERLRKIVKTVAICRLTDDNPHWFRWVDAVRDNSAISPCRKEREMKHAELIARLEAAEVGSRELDALIWDIEDSRPRHSLDGDFPTYKQDPEDSVAFDSPPPYTTSLDAVLALAERVLPDVQFNMATGVTGGLPWVQCYPFPQEEDNYLDAEAAATLPLSICIAILRALDAKTPAP